MPENPACVRCGGSVDTKGRWERDWPLYGEITVGFGAQVFACLGGAKNVASKEHFAWWEEGHPAIKGKNAQEVSFRWGAMKESGVRLCYDCQQELLAVIGRFFGIDKRVAEIKAEFENSET